MRRAIFFSGLLVAFCLRGAATSQAPERLILDGDTLSMWSFPLDSYFESRGMQAEDVPELKNSMSTGLYRRYLGTWEVADGKLYLVRIENASRQAVDLAALFGKKYRNGRVFVEWVTMDLYSPHGACLAENPSAAVWRYYDKEKKIAVQNGKVLSISDYNTLTGGDDPEMIRLWNGRRIDYPGVCKKLEYIVAADFQWNGAMTESRMVEVLYMIDDDLSRRVEDHDEYDVKRNREYLIKQDTVSAELPDWFVKKLARVQEKIQDPSYCAYLQEVRRILGPVKVETMLFCGKPQSYNAFTLKFYFDAREQRVYRLEGSLW